MSQQPQKKKHKHKKHKHKGGDAVTPDSQQGGFVYLRFSHLNRFISSVHIFSKKKGRVGMIKKATFV